MVRKPKQKLPRRKQNSVVCKCVYKRVYCIYTEVQMSFIAAQRTCVGANKRGRKNVDIARNIEICRSICRCRAHLSISFLLSFVPSWRSFLPYRLPSFSLSFHSLHTQFAVFAHDLFRKYRGVIEFTFVVVEATIVHTHAVTGILLCACMPVHKSS